MTPKEAWDKWGYVECREIPVEGCILMMEYLAEDKTRSASLQSWAQWFIDYHPNEPDHTVLAVTFKLQGLYNPPCP